MFETLEIHDNKNECEALFVQHEINIIENIENLGIIVEKKHYKNKIKDCFYPKG